MTKRWSYKAGERGRNRVRAYEEPGGLILLDFHERSIDGVLRRKRISLRHHDREKAKRQADELAAQFGNPVNPDGERVTLKTLFDIYMSEVSPTKSEGTRKHDRASAEMFAGFFGYERAASTLGLRDWDRFIAARKAGGVGPSRRRVRNRQIEYDLKFLVAVFNWATRAGPGDGTTFLERSPLKGLNRPGFSGDMFT